MDSVTAPENILWFPPVWAWFAPVRRRDASAIKFGSILCLRFRLPNSASTSSTNVEAPAPVARAVKPDWNARLLEAAKVGDYQVAVDALRHGASPNTRGFYDMSPLLQAVSRHDTAMATLLLDHGADPNQPKKDGVTPVFLATVFPPKDARDLSLATLLVERGADVTRPGESRQTALEWVAFYGHVPIADFLVRHGADVNAVDRFGQTPLSMAERQHHVDMVAFLTAHGATKR